MGFRRASIPHALCVLIIASSMFVCASCSRSDDDTSSGGPAGPGGAIAGDIIIKGSDTMVHLVTAWAEAFMDANPKVDIAVTGGGSGTGIAALINGTTDICAASRRMKDSEVEQAQAKSQAPVEHVVARDGIAVIVNPANPVSEITMEDLAKIYTGATTSWARVGGASGPIGVLSRESSSGTYAFFREHVMAKEDYTERARLMPATSAIVEAVQQETSAIGYVGLGYAEEAGSKVKCLNVKVDADSEAVAPSEATVKSGDYGIARPLYLYTIGEPTGAIGAFVEFTKSAAGQAIVEENGYVTVD
jgi:phosphate transport system substrate-binding protein